MSEIDLQNIDDSLNQEELFVCDIKNRVETAELLSCMEELKVDLLEAKITILEKDIEIIDLKKQILESKNLS